MTIATGQFTIVDLNDIDISATAPSSPSMDRLWLDSSATPNILKRWNGTDWIASTALSLSELDSTASDKLDNSVQKDTSYNNAYLTQNGMLVKDLVGGEVVTVGAFLAGLYGMLVKNNMSEAAVIIGKLAAELYGIKAFHDDGSYTQLTQNGLERFVDGEPKPYMYETIVCPGSTTDKGWDGFIITGETNEEFKKSQWYSGIWLELPARFKNKNFNVYLALSQLNVPLSNTGTDSVMNLFIDSIDHNHEGFTGPGVKVVAYTEAFSPGEGSYFRGLQFLLIVTM